MNRNAPLQSRFSTAFLVMGMIPAAALGGDLSKYREFQFGADLATVAKQAGASPAEAKIIHRRPALIQELEWRPQFAGATSRTEPAQQIVFTFYGGELFRIVVNYDRYETEGLTTDDIVDAISASYGVAARPAALAKSAQGRYGDQAEVLASWQDERYRFELIRSSYGPSFKLIAVVKGLETQALAAILEAKRLDDQEAPQREAAWLASEEEAAKAKLEKARLANRLKFRP